jgi:signal transduction histidine kinase
MLNIINDIINISKVESGQIEVLKTDNDVLQYLLQFFTNETKRENSALIKEKLHANENLLKPIKKNYMLH